MALAKEMSNIRIGIASWTDRSLIDSGRFYPREAKSPEARLRFYAAQFPIVEVDSSYYAMPSPDVSRVWEALTPDDFVFNVKAFRLFTGHQTAPAALPKDIREALGPIHKKNVYYKDMPEELRAELWSRFREAIQPLRQAGKLGAVHFQFAPWLVFHPENFKHVDECAEQLEDHRLAVEFRNSSWFEGKQADRTLSFERERGLVNVVVDGPQGLANSVPAVWEVTTDALAIVRLHGRNRETWNQKGLTTSAERFNYDYSIPELEELAGKIETLSRKVRTTAVVLNNNYQDQGQRNARELMTILGRSGRPA